jgi:GH35 family endo-1,4-beta-xylanase
MRGHCVLWDCERFIPQWQKDMTDAELRRVVERRCKEVANWFAGRVDEWDLNNEMLHCRWYRDKLGDEIVGDMCRWFKQANPEATLTLNDFNILNNRYRSRLDDYVAQAQGFMAKGYAFGGINCQGHSWDGVTNIGFIQQASTGSAGRTCQSR